MTEAPRCRTCHNAYVRREGDECTRCHQVRTGDWRSR